MVARHLGSKENCYARFPRPACQPGNHFLYFLIADILRQGLLINQYPQVSFKYNLSYRQSTISRDLYIPYDCSVSRRFFFLHFLIHTHNMDPSEQIIVQLSKHKSGKVRLTFSTQDKSLVKAMTLRERHYNYMVEGLKKASHCKYSGKDSILIKVPDPQSVIIQQDQDDSENTITISGTQESITLLEKMLNLPFMTSETRAKPPPPAAAEEEEAAAEQGGHLTPGDNAFEVQEVQEVLEIQPKFTFEVWDKTIRKAWLRALMRRSDH